MFTLGDKLKAKNSNKRRRLTLVLINAVIIGYLALLFFKIPSQTTALLFLMGTGSLLILSRTWGLNLLKGRTHFLLANDRQGFMRSLVLSQKTVFIDGSNIYHFGLENGVGADGLKRLIESLREDNYRVVCFFDANIYFTLPKNGAIKQTNRRFSIKLLQTVFGLKATEIYVVPSGLQADLFIVESLSHLPVSFVVSNDQYRDYAANYDFLAKDNQWRKGIRIRDGQLHLYRYKFKKPVLVT